MITHSIFIAKRILSKDFKAQDEVPKSPSVFVITKGPNLTKEHKKCAIILLFALAGDITDVIWAKNHYIFIKPSNTRLLGLKLGFPDPSVSQKQQTRSNLADKAYNSPNTSLSALVGTSTAVTWAINHSIFIPTVTAFSLNHPMQFV